MPKMWDNHLGGALAKVGIGENSAQDANPLGVYVWLWSEHNLRFAKQEEKGRDQSSRSSRVAEYEMESKPAKCPASQISGYIRESANSRPRNAPVGAKAITV